MLQRIVNIINSSSCQINDGTLFCNNYIVADNDCINYLETSGIIENNITPAKIGDIINLELSLAELNSVGYYEDVAVFILKNKYIVPTGNYYIEEIKCYNTDTNNFINQYLNTIHLIDSIRAIARHTYTDIDINNSLIFREDKALLLPLIYNDADVIRINNIDIENLKIISDIFCENNSDKKFLYINELIDFLITEDENNRFKFLLSHIAEFVDRTNNAYQYYIRNFSYNKLKTELDNAALDYSKKIQSVINDAQTKLIAIPTAFLFAMASMNYTDILNGKNIGIIVGLFIFAWLIELFIRNQRSTLLFIKKNIDVYTQTFKSMNTIVEDSFKTVNNEWNNQIKRVAIIRGIVWIIPVVISIVSIILLLIQKPKIIDIIIQCYNQIYQI
jgi:hypothetical protein